MNWILTALTTLNIRAVAGSLGKTGAAARACLFFLVTGLLAFADHFPSAADVVDPGFTQTTVATGIVNPTAMAIMPDGRIFVNEQQGKIRVINGGGLLGTPFLDISNKIDSRGERGLLGITFDPDFQNNQWVYVYYTSKTPTIHNRVSRFTANGNTAIAGSEKVLLDIQTLSSATNHNGGAIHFSSRGKLLIAVGDNATGSNAQKLSNMKGKLLRINKDGSIPPDNPFYTRTSGNNRSIWALGLRNPFNFALKLGYGIHINDVGQRTWEEINFAIEEGTNYGWPYYEGIESDPKYESPIYAYAHGTGDTEGCAIVGAAFYTPLTASFPSSYVGDYFFGDLCNGWLRGYDTSSRNTYLFAIGLSSLVDIQVDQNGNLYYLERGGGGRLTKVTYTGG